jgi:hypothetical protein
MTNPWGSDWTKDHELLFINTVIGHGWQGIHGAHFKRMHGEDPYPFVYELIDQQADHYHWDTGKKWNDAENLQRQEFSEAFSQTHGVIIKTEANMAWQFSKYRTGKHQPEHSLFRLQTDELISPKQTTDRNSLPNQLQWRMSTN